MARHSDLYPPVVGTLMSHFLSSVPFSIPPLPSRMKALAAESLLVLPAGPAVAGPACFGTALSAAVALASITVTADHDDGAATGAPELPGAPRV